MQVQGIFAEDRGLARADEQVIENECFQIEGVLTPSPIERG